MHYGQGGDPSPKKFSHIYTYPIMIKLDTVIPYLKKNQKIYEPRDANLKFC